MNPQMSPQYLFQGVVPASILNMYTPANGINYKAESPVVQVVVHSAIGATVAIEVQSSIDGGQNWVNQANISVTSSAGTPNAVVQQRLMNILGVQWRACALTATGDA